MKKFFSIVIIIALAIFMAGASDFKFFLNGLDQHPNILGGFLPTGTGIGVNYEGLSFREGDLTQFRLTFDGGYRQRQIFQDPKTGKPLEEGDKVGIFDVMNFALGTRLSQGFGDSWVLNKDLFTAYVGYEGKYERYYDSLILLPNGGGLPKKNDHKIKIGLKDKAQPDSIDDFMQLHGVSRDTQTVYSDLSKDSNFTNTLYTGLTFNYMDDRMVSNEGVLADFNVQFAPGFMNSRSQYYLIQTNVVAGTTLLEVQRKNGLNLFSIVALNRTNVCWVDGSAVPVFVSHNHTLGRKVRGIDNNSYNTNFSLVNNFDVRFASPEPIMDGLFIRFNLFLDMGIYAGNYLNTGKNGLDKYKESGFLASTGFQLELDFIDAVDLGIQMSYLLNGKSFREPDSKWITSATFVLDF